MTSREKFEAWWDEYTCNPIGRCKLLRSGAGYRNIACQEQWEAWNAAESESEQQLEESQREFRAADATIHNLELKLTDMAVQLANAESKCRELAAENVTLNDKMNKLATWPGIEFYSSAWEFCNLDGNDALEFMCDVKTPATDAFLAEVRAQGVEMLREHPAIKLCSLTHVCDEFAAQLRKGAAL